VSAASGATDPKYHGSLHNTDRFPLLRVKAEETQRSHRTHERMSVADHQDTVRFHHLLLRAD
jgi:hypothetical protein